jgi:CheY-like chemotaxis protein
MPSPEMKVLIVDESDKNILALTSVIGDQHYGITRVRSAKEALRLLLKGFEV